MGELKEFSNSTILLSYLNLNFFFKLVDFLHFLESPKRRIEQLALDTNIDLNRTIKLLETEFEKVTRSNEELNRNVNGLSLKVNEINELTSGMAKINNRLDLFEERFKEMLELLKK